MEALLQQHPSGKVVWLYGLSGAGKSTLANLLKVQLQEAGYPAVILDGDRLRGGMNRDLSFSVEDRAENVRRTAEMACVLAEQDIISICALITPLTAHRQLARAIAGPAYMEVLVDCSLEECRRRDVKGLYCLSEQQKLKQFTGVDAAFEPDYQSDLVINTALTTPAAASDQLFRFVKARLGACWTVAPGVMPYK
ncbi:adenylylsulfate kinase [Chitinophaga costaii]|uniref:Adenylyl-sulfate kinase n=1 Tax=Chitinophaga costaii TaxID=1335309 RepID=A0A1C4G6E7_9BACT|nr:adenylyl-sulfate kinase [Chitinophaga costaii]PUZ19696.1 adenylyl-sulfate kinase [Chitinophaga costaii]SCC63321.1 adenylylsulfate kinase [Chitinophaga costaii]